MVQTSVGQAVPDTIGGDCQRSLTYPAACLPWQLHGWGAKRMDESAEPTARQWSNLLCRPTAAAFVVNRRQGRVMLSIIHQLRSIYLCYFSKPAADRPVYRAIRRHGTQKIVELGIGDASRATRMIEIARQTSHRRKSAMWEWTGSKTAQPRVDREST